MKIFNDVRSRSPLGEVGQKPVDTPLLAAGSRAFERIVFIKRGPAKSKSNATYPPIPENASELKGVSEKCYPNDNDPSLALPRKFKRGSWFFKRITRLGKWAIFLKRKNGAEPGSIIEGYEVVRIRIMDKDKMLPSGKVIPKWKELYPGNKQRGTDGFSYPTLELAQAKFLSVTQKEGAELS